jgi:hypothetical protein
MVYITEKQMLQKCDGSCYVVPEAGYGRTVIMLPVFILNVKIVGMKWVHDAKHLLL